MANCDAFLKPSKAPTLNAAASTDSIFLDKKRPVRHVLRKKLIVANQEKRSLTETLDTKDAEINELKKSIMALNGVLNSLPVEDLKNNSSVATTKIVDLGKKNVALRKELDLMKRKNCKLDLQVAKLESELKVLNEEKKRDSSSISKQRLDMGLEELQCQFNQTKSKLFDSLNQNVELKNQLKLAHKCIQQEIGENANLNVLLAAGSNWRGRAQQIMSLQLKVNELKGQLENIRSDGTMMDDCLDEPPVRREQIYHRAEVDILQKDIATLTSHIEEQNQKIITMKTRNKNLVADFAKLKERCNSLEEQNSGFGTNIEAIQDKFNVQKYHYENKLRELRQTIVDMEKEQNNFKFKEEDLVIKCEKLQQTIDGKEECIEQLQSTIKNLEKDLKSVCGDYLFECRHFKKEEFVALLDSLELEKKNLLSLNSKLNERLDEERAKGVNLIDQLSRQKVKVNRLEAKIREIEKQSDAQKDKNKRTQRMIKYANSISTNSTVSSFVFENSSYTDLATAPGSVVENKDMELCELRHQLEIANEKIHLLEDKLTYLTEEKQADAKNFEEIVKSSRTALLNAIHNIKLEQPSQT